eukprot:2941929-Rhodomonas_salina.2
MSPLMWYTSDPSSACGTTRRVSTNALVLTTPGSVQTPWYSLRRSQYKSAGIKHWWAQDKAVNLSVR